jgi:hypothetical protein
MARIRQFFKDSSAASKKHPTEVDCGYAIVIADGTRYLQLNTYGSESRRIPDKMSQTFQLDARAARELSRLIGDSFDP